MRVYLSKTDSCQEARSQMLLRKTVCSLFYACGIKERSKEDYMKVGENRVGIGLQDS